jgi:hypothetical protein
LDLNNPPAAAGGMGKPVGCRFSKSRSKMSETRD